MMPPSESTALWLLLVLESVVVVVGVEVDVKLTGYSEKMSPEIERSVPFAGCCSQPACSARRT